MSSILLAESGSTKTDWCLLQKGKETIHFKTTGINPYLQTTDEIVELLEVEMAWRKQHYTADSISFYGAGAGTPEKQQELANALNEYFHITGCDR